MTPSLKICFQRFNIQNKWLCNFFQTSEPSKYR